MTRVLVVSSVHPPDDPRIRYKLIESLRAAADVTYATRSPGPSDDRGFAVRLLHGPRAWRSLVATWHVVIGRYDVASVHDPELIPAVLVAGLLRRDVVFDVHENAPAQMRRKTWLPGPLGGAAAAVLRWLLRVTERLARVTLAEPGYAGLFMHPHPVFPNYLGDLPVALVSPTDRAGVVYLGDITEARGALTLVRAVGMTAGRPPLTMIGRCSAALAEVLRTQAASSGVDLTLTGYLPHDRAMALVARSRVAVSPLHDIPNYRHSLPTKLLEYLAVGVPVVATDLPGSRDAGDFDGIVWVAPGDPVDLAEGIDLALRSSDLTPTAIAGVEDVRQRFRWPADAVQRFYLG